MAERRGRARKLRLHIENFRRKASIFHITPERYAAAARRHRALARRVDVSIGWDGDILEDALREADLAIGVPGRRDRLHERAPRLAWIHHPSAGVDPLMPFDWLPPDIVLTNNRGVHGAKAEEFIRMAITMLHTRMPEVIAQQRARVWRQVFTPAPAGRTALIIGLGDLGEGAARAARQLGLKVIGVRRSAKACRHADSVHTFRALDRLLPKADFVVIAVPLTAGTRNLLSRERLDRLKPGCGVINIARGPVLDNGALADKLAAGELAGAVLDVVDPEPLPLESTLWDVPNLVITPHISCDDGDDYVALTLDRWFENLARFLQNKALANRVNRTLGY
jgi:phosphoglycerate dehydrogenase-like enzyme